MSMSRVILCDHTVWVTKFIKQRFYLKLIIFNIIFKQVNGVYYILKYFKQEKKCKLGVRTLNKFKKKVN